MGSSRKDYFRELCEEGLIDRYGSERAKNDKELRDRLDYEIGIMERMGFVSYFLITWDFIKWAKDNKIPVGPGRGSAAGSIVAYVLGITDLDPLRYGLIFERFLNPERVSPPDVDVDFCQTRRPEVIEYVRQKYGEKCVSHIKPSEVIFSLGMSENCLLDSEIGFLDLENLVLRFWNTQILDFGTSKLALCQIL